MEAASTAVVVAAKLRPPRRRPTAIDRAELVSRLDDQPSGTMRLIAAPTGWGKSQLLAQWLERHNNVAYLAADDADNDPTRFWRHLLVSIGRSARIDVDDLLSTLRAPSLPLVEEIVEPLLARIDDIELHLVIEDLHTVSSVDVIESIEALIDGASPGIDVTIVTRHDPPLHLPRRRVTGDLAEVRLDDLRFTTDQALQLLTDATDHTFDDDVVAALVDRTEGWPAGLYLAALSMRAGPPPSEFVAGFAGDDQMISDYLTSEVLHRTDDATLDFMLRTSVLDELDPELCDEFLRTGASAVTIDHLRRTNQFIIPTDPHGRRHRYHHLFGEWLRIELERRQPGALRRAHSTAARVYDRRGDTNRAIDHALAARDRNEAVRLIRRASAPTLDSGAVATVARWCAALAELDGPPSRADVALVKAWVAIIEGDTDAVFDYCSTVRGAIASPGWDSDHGTVGEVDVIIAYAHLLRGDFAPAAEAASAARSAGVSQRTGAALAVVEASTQYWTGDPGRDRFERVLAEATELADPYGIVLAQSFLAHIWLDRHELDQAQPWIARAFATMSSSGIESFGYSSMAHLARSRALTLTGNLDGAVTDAIRAVELADRRGDVVVEEIGRAHV